jgi:hypothetical protein
VTLNFIQNVLEPFPSSNDGEWDPIYTVTEFDLVSLCPSLLQGRVTSQQLTCCSLRNGTTSSPLILPGTRNVWQWGVWRGGGGWNRWAHPFNASLPQWAQSLQRSE